MAFSLLLFLVISMCSNAYRLHSLKAPKASVIEDRLAVVEDKRQAEGGFLLAFHAKEGKLRFQQYSKGSWSKWQDLDSPEGKTIISNPVAAHDINNLTTVFCLCDDGQVHYKIQDTDNLVEFGKWLPVGSKLPFDTGVTLKGKDTISVLTYQNKLTIFSRSVTKASRLYWTQEVNGNWSNWVLIGGSSVSLQTDVAIAYNGFSKVFKT